MEEILDLEELQEDILDENLKEFMAKDDETEKLLNEKIDELAKEEEKLSKKENEIRDLEESNREKINSDASADELIEIAGKIKEAEAELASINENIEKLTQEKEELIETKNSIDSSKQEYIKQLNSTNSNYEEQLRKISEAIDVCDNPTLKQVLEEVRNEKTRELTDLEKKRINELKTVLNEPVEEEKTVIEVSEENSSEEGSYESEPEQVQTSEDVVKPVIEDSLVNMNIENTTEEVSEPVIEDPLANINIDNQTNENSVVEEQPIIDIPVDPQTLSEPDAVDTITDSFVSDVTPVLEENNNQDMINIDSILSPSVEAQDLNIVPQDNLVVPEVNQVDKMNENKTKIIYEKDVPSNLLKEIYSSSKIMPSLYDYLDDKNVSEGSFN